ncbi:MAG: STAS domain-containing protein [Planctomycetes bacterium]|nr:STAS domain-containing protein [Planctomycetota bacterium]
MKLDIVEHANGALIVRLLGELDRLSGPMFQQMMQAAIGPKRRRVVVNLKGIDCLDSYNIAILMSLRRAIEVQGASTIFVSDIAAIRHLLKIAGLQDDLALAASEEEALARQAK